MCYGAASAEFSISNWRVASAIANASRTVKIHVDGVSTRSWQPVGCEACYGTGYRGRAVWTELLFPSQLDVKRELLSRADADRIEALAVRNGMTTRWVQAREAVAQGVTSPAGGTPRVGIWRSEMNPMNLDQLIALNDEIAALSRAGIPLGRGLIQVGRDLPARLGKISVAIGERMEQGESLESIFADESSEFPQLYRAVVLAGLRSGKITAATEGLARSLRQLADIRRVAGFAMLYPLLILALATGLFAVVIQRTFPQLLATLVAQGIDRGGLLQAWLEAGDRYGVWLGFVPIAIFAVAFVWWWTTNLASLARTAPSGIAFSWIPGAARMFRYGQIAAFTEILQLLITQRIPLPEALPLAAAAAGGRDLNEDAHSLQRHLEAGSDADWRGTPATGIPPLIAWLINGAVIQGGLAKALREVSRVYVNRSKEQADWIRTTLPSLATISIAGTATLLFAASFFVPWFSLLFRLGASW